MIHVAISFLFSVLMYFWFQCFWQEMAKSLYLLCALCCFIAYWCLVSFFVDLFCLLVCFKSHYIKVGNSFTRISARPPRSKMIFVVLRFSFVLGKNKKSEKIY